MAGMTHNRTILIIEDDPFIAMDLADTFEGHGYNVIGPFADVGTGLREIETSPPDVALLDYNLGRDTSVKIAQNLELQDIPYAFLTGQIGSVVVGQSLKAPTVISKPFIPERLIAIIDGMVA